MIRGILSTIFLDVYNNMKIFSSKKSELHIYDYDALEHSLEDYLISVIGYKIKNNYEDNFREIRKYFENIIYSYMNNGHRNIVECIDTYKQEFIEKLESHKYTNLFIDSMKKLYSKSYDGKIFSKNDNTSLCSTIAINNRNNSFIIERMVRKDENFLPAIYINDIDEFERILKKYIESVVLSDSFYNLFDNEYLNNIPYEDKVKIIFECTIFNATNSDLNHIENFFRRYTDFINDETFKELRSLKYVGEIFDDQLFVMLKRSELEYETPYYLAFMLKNKMVELPNVRLGIETKDNIKIAHIVATQSAQTVLNKNNLNIIQTEIKKNLPKDPYFRFYNPTHLISLLMTFGLLNGMGIKEIQVKDFMPFRYNKTVIDKQMNVEEADKYQTRLTNKNLITYMRLVELVDGVNIISYPEMDMGLNLRLDDEVKCANEFLQNIYDMSYNVGKENKIDFSKESIK